MKSDLLLAKIGTEWNYIYKTTLFIDFWIGTPRHMIPGRDILLMTFYK